MYCCTSTVASAVAFLPFCQLSESRRDGANESLIGPGTSQVIHSVNEAVAASDVICHVVFPKPKQALKQWFYGIVVPGLKHVSKLQCRTAITSESVRLL